MIARRPCARIPATLIRVLRGDRQIDLVYAGPLVPPVAFTGEGVAPWEGLLTPAEIADADAALGAQAALHARLMGAS